ncbi:HlyD family efflux transporter periplasmic adaptor subunit [Spongorhabdus nitratireducens]
MFDQAPAIPVLRDDLNLMPGEADPDGSPIWLLQDPLSNRFFRLGEIELAIVAALGAGAPEQIAAQVTWERQQPVSTENVEEVIAFVRANNLAQADPEQIKRYQQYQAAKPGILSRMLKTYLFIRIPLFRPDRFLSTTLPWVRWLGSWPVIAILILSAFAGLILVTQRFDQFLTTFQHFFSWKGIVAYALTLFAIKMLHELGHAYVAKAKGCRVPVLGVAFLVGWPVLYTDTSEAWKLTERRSRMAIGAAGVATELGIAAIAVLLWNLASEGIWKSIFFLLATTTWLMSVLVNFNPMMRFDGYYLLSDWLRTPNLEPRAFAMTRWWLREKMFGLGEEPPEPPRTYFIVHSFCIWVYRFFLFLGIAVLVYSFFIKVLGIFLFLVEIVYFIMRPVWNEMRRWWQRRNLFSWNLLTIRTLLLAFLVIALVAIPWRNSITLTAWLQGRYITVFAPQSGQLASSLPEWGEVAEEGALLTRLSAPKLEQELQDAREKLAELAQQVRAQDFDVEMRERALVVKTELATQLSRVRSLQRQLDSLQVYAPANGQIIDVSRALRINDWVSAGEPLFSLVDRSNIELEAYLEESDLWQLSQGMEGWFYPENPGYQPFRVRVDEIESGALRELKTPYPASVFGGGLAVKQTEGNVMVPVMGTYRVFLQPLSPLQLPDTVIRGNVVIEGRAESYLSVWWHKAETILWRESGF